MNDGVYVGHAETDAALDRGWLLGHFKDPDDLRHTDDLETGPTGAVGAG